MNVYLKNSNKFTIIDDKDAYYASVYTWYLSANGYAVNRRSGRRLHRMITSASKGVYVDHINGDKLDNRRSNLRLCSYKENNRNVGLRKIAKRKSNFKGVHLVAGRYWSARITVDYKEIHLGSFKTEKDAALAYDLAAKKFHGEFARVNFR